MGNGIAEGRMEPASLEEVSTIQLSRTGTLTYDICIGIPAQHLLWFFVEVRWIKSAVIFVALRYKQTLRVRICV